MNYLAKLIRSTQNNKGVEKKNFYYKCEQIVDNIKVFVLIM